ncbi:hypothetical protein AQJ91_03395 [Streptomyces dysideae]|uniref:Secreted protein n=1 Tax=Streptomyces dysideae TaxID=909626 RepID=A0A101V4U5_9ACTN|nr:hypothetical protein AQJ91_03395 [Streptomyces dysideae]
MLPAVLLSALLASLVLATSAGQAHAVGYRYWSFWERDGNHWAYATQGPSIAVPADGDVQGLRFSVSADSSDAAQPRGTTAFPTICARTPPQAGRKRVALVIDFGTTADAPSGEAPPKPRTACARVPSTATTAEALASVAKPLRYNTNALLCAIGGYPETGCGEQVAKENKPTATEPADEGEDGGPSVGLFAGVGVVAVLGAAAVWQARRRRA